MDEFQAQINLFFFFVPFMSCSTHRFDIYIFTFFHEGDPFITRMEVRCLDSCLYYRAVGVAAPLIC